MTTAHRSQLEARSGAKGAGYVPTSTEHARLIPGHKKIKYRKGLPNERDFGIQKSRSLEDTGESSSLDTSQALEKVSDRDLGDTTSGSFVAQDQINEISEEGEGYNEDDEDDRRILPMELNKSKAEGTQPKVKKEEEDVTNFDSLQLALETTTTSKSWRNDTVFGRSKNKDRQKVTKKISQRKDGAKGYVNDLTRSEYHKDILRKYVK